MYSFRYLTILWADEMSGNMIGWPLISTILFSSFTRTVPEGRMTALLCSMYGAGDGGMGGLGGMDGALLLVWFMCAASIKSLRN